jgi:hypothetical protein
VEIPEHATETDANHKASEGFGKRTVVGDWKRIMSPDGRSSRNRPGGRVNIKNKPSFLSPLKCAALISQINQMSRSRNMQR